MIRRIFTAGLVLAGLSGTALVTSPALRAELRQRWAALGGWTKNAQEDNPVGFASYAQRRLKHDLELMEKTRRELAGEVAQLARKIRQQQALADQAQQLA